MSLNEGTYKWTIDDPKLLNKIVNAKNGDSFLSDIFQIAQLNWQIRLFPNGDNDKTTGSFCVYLHLKGFPVTWKKISLNGTIESPQTKSKLIFLKHIVENDVTSGWPDNTLRLNEVKQSKFTSLIFVISIKIIEIRLKENDTVYYHLKFNYIKQQNLVWKLDQKTMNALTHCDNGKRLGSNIYNNMWAIQLCPNGDTKGFAGKVVVFLGLCAFPLNVAAVTFQWNLSIKELNFKQTKTIKVNVGSEASWMKVGLFNQFKKCQGLTMMVDVLIITEYDKNGNEIRIDPSLEWDKYIKQEQKQDDTQSELLTAQWQSYQHEINDKLALYDAKITSLSTNIDELITSNREKDQRIKSLTAQLTTQQNTSHHEIQQIQQQIKSLNDKVTQILEEEKKDEDNGNKDILNEIKKLKQEINKIKSNKIEPNAPLSDLDKLRIFFEVELNLPDYLETILENGFEDIQSLIDITSDDLKEMGVKKIAHRKQILKGIREKNLDHQKNVLPPPVYEGSTAYI